MFMLIYFMKTIKIFYILFLNIAILIPQSPINSLGHGTLIDSPDASSLGLSSTVLIPSGNNFFSLHNPTTWTQLDFTYLSVNYNSNFINSENYKLFNSFLSGLTFIVPVKNKFGFGLGMRPYSRKDFEIFSKTESINFNNEVYSLNRTYSGSGGISSFFNSLSYKISKKNTLATQIDFLFGSYNEERVSYVLTKEYNFNQTIRYKSTMLSFFYELKDSFKNRDFSIFSSYNFPIGKKYITYKNDYEFIGEINPLNIGFTLPSNLRIGLLYNLASSVFISSEFSNIKFSSKNSTYSNLFDHEIKSSNRLNLGIQKMKKTNSRDFLEKIQYRVGFFTMGHYIRLPEYNVNETGLSFGFGFPFGVSENQIDLGFCISKRNGINENNEILTKFSINMLIGDLWLIKGKRR